MTPVRALRLAKSSFSARALRRLQPDFDRAANGDGALRTRFKHGTVAPASAPAVSKQAACSPSNVGFIIESLVVRSARAAADLYESPQHPAFGLPGFGRALPKSFDN